MELRPLREQEIQNIYQHYFPEAFPKEEIRPWGNLQHHLREGRYPCYGYFDDRGELCTYAFFFQAGELILLDYLATLPHKRSSGLGGVFLNVLACQLPDMVILAEVEAPISGDEAVDMLRKRRISFYERNGFVQQPLMSRVYGVTYRLMTAGKAAPPMQLHEQIQQLYQRLFIQPEHQAHIQIWQQNV